MVFSGGIRAAALTDLDALVECDPVAVGDVERRTQIESAVISGQCQVWEFDGKITGFIIKLPLDFFQRDFVSLIVVSGSHRRQGIGSALMRVVVETSPRAEVWTSTNESNVAMRGLLAREGWQLSGTLTGLDDGDPEFVFFKRGKI